MITYQIYVAHHTNGSLQNLTHATVTARQALRPRTILQIADIRAKPESSRITHVYHGEFIRQKEDVGLSNPIPVGKLLDASQVRMDRRVSSGALLFVY
jgi:hypothetical protein